jgi:hypothetical protein
VFDKLIPEENAANDDDEANDEIEISKFEI